VLGAGRRVWCRAVLRTGTAARAGDYL